MSSLSSHVRDQDYYQRQGLDHELDILGENPYKPGDKISTRKAFGEALADICKQDNLSTPKILALDGDVGNSTMTECVKKA